MNSERKSWKRDVRDWQRQIDQANAGLDGSKVSAEDLVGPAPEFKPSAGYRERLEVTATNLQAKLERGNLTIRQRARREEQLKSIQNILKGRS